MHTGKKKILILFSHEDLSKHPRFQTEIDALKDAYTILAAANYGDTSNTAGYTFISLLPRQTSGSFTFHYKWPLVLNRIFIFPLLFKFIAKINQLKKQKREREYPEYVFNLLNKYDFDLLIAHQLTDLPLALELARAKNVKIIFNTHEYYPRTFEDVPEWVKNQQPVIIKACTDFLPKMDAIFTVGQNIADEYKKEFGIESIIITNAKKFQPFSPVNVLAKTIRIIHHGSAIRSRGIEEMIEMMGFLGESYSLDLMLLPIDVEYTDELKALASKYPNIKFRPIVPTAKIAAETNNYDIGCFLLSPRNFNYLNALPNKFFEFIQARLAIAIGPSPEMAGIVKKYDLGVIAKDFTAKSMAEEIGKLSPEKIMYYKNQCDKYAFELSSEKNEQLILETVNKLIS